jgi:hypothetical protein
LNSLEVALKRKEHSRKSRRKRERTLHPLLRWKLELKVNNPAKLKLKLHGKMTEQVIPVLGQVMTRPLKHSHWFPQTPRQETSSPIRDYTSQKKDKDNNNGAMILRRKKRRERVRVKALWIEFSGSACKRAPKKIMKKREQELCTLFCLRKRWKLVLKVNNPAKLKLKLHGKMT